MVSLTPTVDTACFKDWLTQAEFFRYVAIFIPKKTKKMQIETY